MGKLDKSRKKNLRSKDLSLEERIRQLTCVDPEEDALDTCSENSLPIRTSPSGEEERSLKSANADHGGVSQASAAYRKITDLFTQKKPPTELNLPDIGLGNDNCRFEQS